MKKSKTQNRPMIVILRWGKMKKSKFILFVSLFMTIAMTGILFVANQNSNIQVNDVAEYSAIVTGIEKIEIDGNLSYRISTDKFLYDLLVTKIENLDYDVSNIQNETVIVFGIEKKYISLLESKKEIADDMFVPIISLKTENQNILTLDDYNRNFKEIGKIPNILCVIIILFSILSFIKSILSLKNKT